MLMTPLGFAAALLTVSTQTDHTFSWLLKNSLGAFSIAYLTAVVMAWLKLSTDVYYLLSLDARAMSIKAAEEVKRRESLESINAELHKRNEIISTFVRPSVLREMDLGSDPRLLAPRITDKAILICDMRNFTPLTSKMVNAEAQAEFINLYYRMMIEQVFEAGGEVDKLMGDAVMALFPNGRAALDAAMKMRLTLKDYNRKQIEAGMAKIDNVISISKGPALEANIGSSQKLDRTLSEPQ
ncbi:MAG: adenylate/guanylate cyclase domain-containing protein [Chitinispirillaceae bacterium]